MKKLNVLLLAFGFLFMLNSCSKSEEYQNVAMAHTINQNESYTFELPATDDPYKVTTEAKNATISMIGLSVDGNPIYNYTPSLDFVGTDLIVLTTYHNKVKRNKKGDRHHDGDNDDNYDDNEVKDYHRGGKGMCGGAKKEIEDDYIVTINITVLPVVPTL